MADVKKEKIVINDRLDIALLDDIPNLHLPDTVFQLTRVKRHFPHLQIGRSVHSLEKAKQAERDGVDYVLYGHCFETNSKKGKFQMAFEPIIGNEKGITNPCLCNWGITLNNVECITTIKADGIAVMSGIFSKDPLASTKPFLRGG